MKTNNVYLANRIKSMDENCGVPSDILMSNAASALYRVLEHEGRLDGNICIVCGKGNNGGDGYALACILRKEGKRVTVYAVDEPVSPLTRSYSQKYSEMGGAIADKADTSIRDADTVVECLFGFSFKGKASGKYVSVIEEINSSKAFVLSADIPAGLIADSDALPECAVKADVTCTFTAQKCALVSQPAKSVCGKVVVEDIGVPKDVLGKETPFAVTGSKELLSWLPKRIENSHKGTYGTVAALCGNEEMCGAAYLACNGALRTGAGLVRLYTDKACGFAVKTMMPECIVSVYENARGVMSTKPKSLLIGCGCGRIWDKAIKELLATTDIPTVLDADGINSTIDCIDIYRSVKPPLIITPHPGEFARLCRKTVADINNNRINNARDFAKAYGVITVLKGNSTVVASPDGRLYINNTGNSGLAKGGSGDVLAGIIASLLAQGLEPFKSAALGVYLHGAAADRLAEEKGVYAMLPSEIAEVAGKIMYFG